jgi:hypothetical protein
MSAAGRMAAAAGMSVAPWMSVAAGQAVSLKAGAGAVDLEQGARGGKLWAGGHGR